MRRVRLTKASVAFAIAVAIGTSLAPGQSADATTCGPPDPPAIYLKLDSVIVDGTAYGTPETWAQFTADYPDRDGDPAESVWFWVPYVWDDKWSMDGSYYDRTQE